MSFSVLRVATVAFALFTCSVVAQDKYSQMISHLETHLGIKVDSVSESPLPGIYNVNTDKGLFYTTEKGEYLMQGRILKVGEEITDETEQVMKTIRLAGVNKFKDSMIVFKAPKEKYQITVFTDTTCGFCQKLHAEMDVLNELGITVNYLAFPRAGLNSEVYQNTVSIWCAKDPQGAITQAKLKQTVPSESCANEVADHYKFGQKIGVNGTPNIIMPDGSIVQGYVPAVNLVQALRLGSQS